MKFSKLLLIFGICIFLINSINAFVAPGGEWENQDQSITIDMGESVDFNAYAGTTKSSMYVNVKLFDSSSNLLKTFEDKKVGDTFSKTYTLTQNHYNNEGSYYVNIIASDDDGSDTYPLDLTVNPASQPSNNPPVLNSIGDKSIDENSTLQFNVSATDADGNNLTYSASNLPLGASFNQNTKQFSWTPNFIQSGSYDVTFTVSDGIDTDSETITITVNDVQPTLDTTAPNLTILGQNPVNVEVFSNYTDAGATAFDNIDGNLTSNITITNNVNTSVLGSYQVNYSVSDSAGNTANATRTVNVVDTTKPVIKIVSPINPIYNYKITLLDYSVSDNYDSISDLTCWYSTDGGTTNSTPDTSCSDFSINSKEGTNTWIVWANDTSGNIGKDSVTFSVDLPNGNKNGKKDKGKGGYQYEDFINQTDYLEQFEKENEGIDLTPDEEEKSWLAKLWESIVNFFKRLFR